jgi:Ca2+/H+ antiporter, TMEM165/GDT1 family
MSGLDWKLLATTFGAVFVAELGDKTQLATLSLSAGKEVNRLSVFLGSASALVCTSLIAVLAGELISRYVPPQYLRRGAGAIFIVLGLLYIFRKA